MGHFDQDTSAIGHQTHGTSPPRIGRSDRHTPDSVPKHTGHFGQDTSAIGHQAHRTPHEASDTPRTRSPHARETSAKTHRPSVTKHMGHLTKRPTHLGLGHHMHGKLRPRHIGHRSPSTWDTSRSVRHTSDSVTTCTGNFGQGTSAIGHQAHGTRPEGATHPPPTHLGLGHQTHGTLRPRHIGHRSPSTWDTS